jgi:hypothetical protein
MTREVHHECLTGRLVNASVGEQELHVEKISGVLTVERRTYFAPLEIGRSERGYRDGHLERLLRCWDEIALLGWEHAAANDGIRLDHDSRRVVLDEQAHHPTGIIGDRLLHLNPGDGSLESVGDTAERLADVLDRQRARLDRKVSQIDIDREPRQIAPEKFDGG